MRFADRNGDYMINQESHNQKMKRTVISVILIAVIVICIAVIAVYMIKGKQASDVYEELQQTVQVTEDIEKVAETETTEESRPSYEGMPEVDFETLWKTNTDICAWVTVPGTQVNYPVLQNASSKEPHDTYYLMHTVEKASGLPGAIYIEPCNAADFTDANTVMYGHNMKNGTMFGSLHEFEDDTFFEEHQYAYIVTPEKNQVYQIFAAILYDDRHIMGTYDFSDTANYQLFLDSLTSNRNMGDIFREGVTVTTDDKIITMSTCVKGQDNKRLLVEAVLIDEYER